MTQIPAIGYTSVQTVASLTITSFGIPFTSNISSGFTIGLGEANKRKDRSVTFLLKQICLGIK
jgi:hypothetical protein